MPEVDLVVAGSVAVSLDGGRIGKGEGYSEIEYAILREVGRLGAEVKIATTVHECQILQRFPVEQHDVSIDYILTPTRVIETKTRLPKHGKI